MERYIKKLPKKSNFDYKDIFGGNHYHSERRNYVYYRGTILSTPKNNK